MSMSTNIVFLRERDERFEQMKRIAEECDNANIRWPDDVIEYFNDDKCFENALEIKYKARKLTKDEYTGMEMREGYIINVVEIPEGTKQILFINSW